MAKTGLRHIIVMPLKRRHSTFSNETDEDDSDQDIHLMSRGVRSRHGSSASPGNGLVSPFYDTVTDSGSVTKDHTDVEGECGCGPCYPKSFQFLNGPKCLLVWLCIAAFAQGMIVNGLINVVITTIERRFHLTSSQSGLIASTYDIASLVFLLPVSYFGGMGNRARWLAVGSAALGAGSIIFTIPHYISDHYNAMGNVSTACIENKSHPVFSPKECSSPLENYKYLFIVAQILHGAGAAPLYTLGVSFLDDSVKPKLSSLYVGIYYAFAMLGPACGFLLGGQFLSIYVDFDRLSSWTVSPNSPAWVGAWWLGFLGAGIVSLLTAIPLFMYPAMLPRTLEYRQERKNETHADVHLGEVPAVHTTVTGNLHALPKAIKTLLINRTFVFLNLAGAADAFLTLGLATYAPKVFQSMFGFNASTASIIIGAATIPFGAGGTLLGGYIIKRFGLDCRGILRVCVVCSFLALLTVLIFLIRCPNERFAGVNVPYKNQSTISKAPALIAPCNAHCFCDEELYDPVCSLNDQTAYLTPCHAGCKEDHYGASATEFYDCLCIGSVFNKSKPVATKTSCSTNCGSMHWVFVAFFALLILFTFLSSIPAVSATLRCVGESQRPFAMGMQWIIVRLLGSVPGPLCLGAIIDTVCTYWQPERCGTGKGRCLSYDNAELSNAVFTVGIVGKIICFSFFLLAWWFYKPAEAKSVMVENPSDVGLERYGASINVSTQSLDGSRSG